MINNKEDLYGTYVKTRDDELLSLYIDRCLSFGFVLSSAFSGKKILDNDLGYAALGIDGECVWAVGTIHRKMKRELTLEDLIPQTNIETPEEKEAQDLINTSTHQYESVASKEVEWVNGELLEFNGEPCIFIGMSEGFPVVKYTNDADSTLAGEIDEIFATDMLSKPETETERVEREELEAAYDLYVSWNNSLGHESVRHISTFKNDDNYALFRFFIAKGKNLI